MANIEETKEKIAKRINQESSNMSNVHNDEKDMVRDIEVVKDHWQMNNNNL